MSNQLDDKCIWCQSEDVYLMGEDGWFRYLHCGGCSADYVINMQKLAWTEDQINKIKQLEKEKDEANN